jgi:hypothetical protein
MHTGKICFNIKVLINHLHVLVTSATVNRVFYKFTDITCKLPNFMSKTTRYYTDYLKRSYSCKMSDYVLLKTVKNR